MISSVVKRSQITPGHTIVVCVVALITIGIIMVTSAGLTIDAKERLTVLNLLTGRPLIHAGLSIVALILGSFFQPQWLTCSVFPKRFAKPAKERNPCPVSTPKITRILRWAKYWIIRCLRALALRLPFELCTWLFVLICGVLLLVRVSALQHTVNGATRWIRIGSETKFISMQPSEIAKWLFLIVIVIYAARCGVERLRKFWTGFVPALFLIGIVCAIIIGEDLGTAVLIGAVSIALLFAAGVRWWHIALLMPLPIAGITAAILSSQYRINRVLAFINPYSDPEDTGYHVIQSMSTISDGAVTGRGLGHGVHKFQYLPEDTTDFLFSVICEEVGIFGAAFVIFLYAVLLLAAYAVLRKQKSDLHRLIILGCLLTIGFQALMNLMVVTGLAPTKGIALPLLSSGGTGWIMTTFAFGWIVGLDRRASKAHAQSKQTHTNDGSLQTGVPPIPAINSISASGRTTSLQTAVSVAT